MPTCSILASAWRRIDRSEYTAEPLLKILPSLSLLPHLKVHCYGSKEHERLTNELAVRAASLTLQTALTDRVDVREWMSLLEKSSEIERQILAEEKNIISEKAHRSCLCLLALGRRRLNRALSEDRHSVKTKYIGGVYHFTPLEILERRLRSRTLSSDEIERLIRCHLKYVRNYICLSSNRDRAYYQWAYDEVPWLRNRIHRQTIRLLDFLKDQL